YRVHPPLRKPEDIDALIQGIFDKTVDCIATDHAPHTKKDKMAGCPGMSSIEIAFSICYTFLVKTKKISLKKLSELMSFTPAKILGINKGSIKNGIKADLVLIDTSFNYSINPSDFLSKGKNTPFSGKKISGKVLKVIKDGIVRFDNGKFNERKG
ncbi:MAG: amidohydrolase family protein, partial [Bacteroidota bacterium]